MRSSQVAVLGGLVTSALGSPFLEARGCGNNCARAVIASNFPSRPTVADCSSYLAVTTTPAVFTHYVTATAFETQTETATSISIVSASSVSLSAVPDKRTVTVRPIPTYATACQDAAAYSTACACIGIAPHTVEAPTPSTTVTVTSTQTIAATTTSVLAVETQGLTNGGFESPALLAAPWKYAQKNTNPADYFNMTLSDTVSASGSWSLRINNPARPVEENRDGIFAAWQKVVLLSRGTYRISLKARHNSTPMGFAAAYAYFTPESATTELPFPELDWHYQQTEAKISRFEPFDEFVPLERTITLADNGEVVTRGYLVVRIDSTYNFFDPIEYYIDDVALELVSAPA